MLEPKHVGENFLRQRIHQVTHNLLIPDDPSVIGRVGNGLFLLVIIFNLKELGRGRSVPSSSAMTLAPRRVGRA
jgi:hypothetical protein